MDKETNSLILAMLGILLAFLSLWFIGKTLIKLNEVRDNLEDSIIQISHDMYILKMDIIYLEKKLNYYHDTKR